MTKKIRFIILLICFLLFFSITPYLIMYSLGYHIDFKNQKIVATGGIYVRANPSGTDVFVDSKINQKSSFFSNSVFIQDLPPNIHSVLVKKDGYIDYQKSVTVKEKEVVKIENITLFKNNISFALLASSTDYFLTSPDERLIFLVKTENKITKIGILNLSDLTVKNEAAWPSKNGTITEAKWSQDLSKILIKTDGNYFVFQPSIETQKITQLPALLGSTDASFNPESSNEIFFIKNKNLERYSIIKSLDSKEANPAIILKNVAAYQISSNRIIWFSYNGIVYNSDISGVTPTGQDDSMATVSVAFDKTKTYKIAINSKVTFLKEGDNLLWQNKAAKSFEPFLSQVNDFKNSPDDQNIFYASDNGIWLDHSNYNLSQIQGELPQKILLNKFYEKISDCFWLNNDYLIFKADNKIKISEIDNRGNINIIDLPDKFLAEGGKMAAIVNPKIYFNSQDKKVYILSDGNLISSDRLLP